MNRIAQSLLPEYDQELLTTRKVLNRLPPDKLDFKPHEKSMTMRKLAAHIAEMHNWGTKTLQTDSLDLNPPGGEPMQPTVNPDSVASILAGLEKNAAEFRDVLATYSDADFMKPWSLLVAGNTIFTMPKVAVIRGMVLNHVIHHRAQLSVYLRMNDVALPAMYGPSADEQN